MSAIKKKEKRILKGYKIKDSVYQKAKKRASKNKVPLATTIENWVTLYSEGHSVGLISISASNKSI